MHGRRHVPGPVVAAVTRARHGLDLAEFQRRHVNHLKPRRRIAQQPMGARSETRGEHEAIRARAEPRHEIPLHVTEAGKVLERAQVLEFVEQERDGLSLGPLGLIEPGEQAIERRPGRIAVGCRRRRGDEPTRACGRGNRREAALRRGGGGREIHVVARRTRQLGEARQEGRASRAAAAQQHRDSSGVQRREDASLEDGAFDNRRGNHLATGMFSMGILMPWRPTAAIAEG